MTSPPSNNMGALITGAPEIPLKNQVLVDWLSWTLKVLDPYEAIRLSGLSCLSFESCDHGAMGYRKSLRSGNVVVFYDGRDVMGCHISMTGQGCRQYEGAQNTPHCWYQLIVLLLSVDASFTRLDLAIDNVDGVLDMRKLEWNVRRKRVRSLFKGGQKIEKFSFLENAPKQGKTLYLGSPQSLIKVRFYDKAAQLCLDGHWVRCELQLMAERAQTAVKHLFAGMEAGTLAVKVLNHYFSVINLDDSNKSRCSLQGWWSSWLTTTDSMRISVMKAIKVIDEVVSHIKRQYAPTFAMLKKFLGVAGFHDFMSELISSGTERLSKKHEMIMACSRLVCEDFELPF